ncbi:ABC transporter substrate-binding protein [Natronosalvus halobius]|uniref:ABC transporter substrate-binding protein n=1 Tax=Natronosalvus halobius TaxID=2953746 RepID=UPI00209E628E|nr:PotD/PotF family extracellular solute-binding protein [Natronosalvus halobius]USZ73690.1 PotD/PotF family extracellular solute-binding protein [Natronosalvus halobius]
MVSDNHPRSKSVDKLTDAGSTITRRRWIQSSVATATVAGLAGCLGGDDTDDTSITFHGFGTHVDPIENMAEDFEEETGISVNVSPFQDDWQVLARQRAGGGDLDLFQMSMRAVPSAREEELIQPIRPENVPNLENINDRYSAENAPWESDGDTWSAVACHFGSNSLAWNTEEWPLEDEPTSWRDLLDPELEGDVAYSQRPNYAVCTTYLQYWPDEPREFEANYDERIQQVWDSMENDWKPQVGVWLEGGPQANQAFANANVIAGHQFPVIVKTLQNEGHPIKDVIPEEGAFMYFDGMAIPAGVEDPKREAAEQFINYFIDPENRQEYLESVPTGTTFDIPEEYQSEGYKNNTAVMYEDRLSIFDPVFVGSKADEWTSEIQEILRS